MHHYETKATVDDRREITIKLPDDFPPGAVHVRVDEQTVPKNQVQAILQLMDEFERTCPEGRSKEDIDRQIAEERDSWDDEDSRESISTRVS